MSWQYVEIDEVYRIHRAVIARAGTQASVRDFALLHSAVERPKASYVGRDLYPTVFTKAAALLQSLTLNHPFSDGNKRTAWLSAKRFLYLNGYLLESRGMDAADFMVYVDNDKPMLLEISKWLREHSRKSGA